MVDLVSHCARSGCRSPAAATLSFSYAGQTVWLYDLTTEAAPVSYALCLAHANAFKAPKGWTTEDRRSGAGPLRDVSTAS